uniref:26S proteasome non-ATPase regulatory subunit 9 n=1 Tax=Anopheles farauti TaxID=69004 RepID=A0A182QA98_9DIPT
MSREDLLKLVERKKELEAQIEEHGLILKANKIDMNQPLVDEDGYPRNDVDVISVRKARHAINCLQTTRRSLMAEIEAAMNALHQNARNNNVEPMEIDEPSTVAQPALQPFAIVEGVEPGLLAEQMGIKIGDQILQIGSLYARNFKSLNQIQTVLMNSQGKSVRFTIRKPNTTADVILEAPIQSPGTRLGIKFKLV